MAGWVAAILACGACCAGPLLGLSGAVVVLSTVAAIWIPSLAGLVVVAALVGYRAHRRRRAATVRTRPAVTDLGLPSVPAESNPAAPVIDRD